MSDCAELFPPSGDVVWFLEVVDAAAVDEGTIERFEVFGPDGALVGTADVPVAIPDNDPAGHSWAARLTDLLAGHGLDLTIIELPKNVPDLNALAVAQRFPIRRGRNGHR